MVTTRNCQGQGVQTTGAPVEAAQPSGLAVFQTRTIGLTYSADKRFVATATNALNEVRRRGPLTGPPSDTQQIRLMA